MLDSPARVCCLAGPKSYAIVDDPRYADMVALADDPENPGRRKRSAQEMLQKALSDIERRRSEAVAAAEGAALTQAEAVEVGA